MFGQQYFTPIDNLQDLMKSFMKNQMRRERCYSDSDISSQDIHQTNNQIDDDGCQHQNKQKQNYTWVCLDCGMILENISYEEVNYGYQEKRNFFVPIRDKAIRDMIKHSTFENTCKDRITNYIKQEKRKNRKQNTNKPIQQLPTSLIDTTIQISNYILDDVKVKGNNNYKLFTFLVQLICRQHNIVITSKQLCVLLGFSFKNYTYWIYGGLKIFQQFKYRNQKFILMSDDNIVKHIQELISQKEAQQTNINESEQLCEMCDIKNKQKYSEILKNYELDNNDILVQIFGVLSDAIQTHNILFKHTQDTKNKLVSIFILYLNVVYKYQQENELEIQHIYEILQKPLGFQQKFWKSFLTQSKKIQVPIIKFKEMMSEFQKTQQFGIYINEFFDKLQKINVSQQFKTYVQIMVYICIQ